MPGSPSRIVANAAPSLDCLNRLMDALIMSNGPDGVRHWLVEVQTFIRVLQKRVFQRMPLYVLASHGLCPSTVSPRLDDHDFDLHSRAVLAVV